MKRLLMICIICTGCIAAHAQTQSDGFYANKHSSADDDAPVVKTSEFEQAQITIENGLITFSNLPVEKKAIWAMVTNPDGEAITQMKVNPSDNVMDVHKLHKGMYFVTLVYRNSSKKAFVIHL